MTGRFTQRQRTVTRPPGWCPFSVVSNSAIPMDCRPPGSSVHGIFQAQILEWVAVSSSRGSSWLRDWASISCIGKWILYHWTTWEWGVEVFSAKFVWIIEARIREHLLCASHHSKCFACTISFNLLHYDRHNLGTEQLSDLPNHVSGQVAELGLEIRQTPEFPTHSQYAKLSSPSNVDMDSVSF